jgi:hypothetical protein
MAIHDLLWACPDCHAYASIRTDGREEVCTRCNSRFRRGSNSSIMAIRPDGSREARTAVEWEARLPPIDAPNTDGTLGPDSATIRIGQSKRPVLEGKRLLGFAERFGPKTPATLRLDPGTLEVDVAGSQGFQWALEELTAVQPSSSALQLNTRTTLLSVRFENASVRRWEAVLCRFLRERARELGRGDVAEFQPRIRYA